MMSDPADTELKLKPASRCPTPRKPKTSELPDVPDEPVAPLDFESTGGLYTFNHERLDDLGLGNTEYSDLSAAELYELNQQFLNDSVPVRPLIDDLAPMSSLRVEYENGSPAFLKQIDWLNAHGFTYIRRTRGDGDCFYRSFGFTYVERLLQSPDRELAVSRSLKSLQSTNQKLESAGIQALVFEDFLDVFTSLIERIVKPGNEGGTLNAEGLLKAFQSDEVSNATVMYLRLLTSAQILLDRDFFQSFVVHPDTKEPMDVDSFCANFVQALGKEADNVEMNALCSALELNLDVAYLNGGRTDVVDFIEFRSDANPEADPLMLLYRPGHYDILVRAS